MGTARYSGEFKRDAVALVESSGRRISSVAQAEELELFHGIGMADLDESLDEEQADGWAR
ncbi:transposase [Kitasatospora sp. NPDC050463]|uniref:transposase n=1 Tax=Kitasatospora sp. NPDC050463 TaxID=3155786 RepID=UPI0033F8B31E